MIWVWFEPNSLSGLTSMLSPNIEETTEMMPAPGAVMIFGPGDGAHQHPAEERDGAEGWRAMRVVAVLGLPRHIRPGQPIGRKDWAGRSRLCGASRLPARDEEQGAWTAVIGSRGTRPS